MAGAMVDNDVQLTKLLPAVRFTKLPSSLLKFPPSPEPAALPPPPNNPSFAHPFTISAEWYNALLDPWVPITVAIIYATTVTFLNSVNARRNWKPWAMSKTSIFKAIVILHNVILATYSAWTFLGMLNALMLAIPDWQEGHGVPGVVDALCKIQGPRGIGSAATYSEQSRAWGITNRAFHLAADGLGPERTDVGRMWNEGLAFYGWIFYLSKFYEVIDTAIILAKGKKSSFLQTYHHAGAMICMWAGIRYMSPPIWMFVFVNSFIHALMYTFYLCSAIRVRIPKPMKRALTTMQITQFVVGATYAFLHLFVKYQIPVSVPYLYQVAPKIASMAVSDVSSVASSAVAEVTADTGNFLMKLALRAAGFEGLAENVGVSAPVLAANGMPASIPQNYVEQAEQRYRDELQWVHCLDTSGQAFAILLNCLYLAPLTWLFARFFVKAYLTQLERRRSSASSDRVNLAKTYEDAKKGVGRRLSEALLEMHATADSSENDSPIVESSESVNTLKQKAADVAEKTSKAAGNLRQKATEAAQSAKENAGAMGNKIAEVQREVQKSTPATEDVSEKAKKAEQKVEEKVDQKASEAKREASEKTSSQGAQAEPGSKDDESSKVTEDKSFADAVKEESEFGTDSQDQLKGSPPNGDGTGAEEASGSQNNTSKVKKEPEEEKVAKKEEEKIIDESQPVRDEEVKTESGTDETQTNGRPQSSSSNIPRPKKLGKKKA